MDSALRKNPNNVGIYEPFPPVLRYLANAVSFDGTNDWLTRGADLTGSADGTQLTISVWLRSQADGGTGTRILCNTTTVGGATVRLRVNKSNNNLFQVVAANAAGTIILDISSTIGSVQIADGWVNCLFSCDLTDVGKRHLYINGISDLATVSTYTNDTIDYTQADWAVGGNPDGTVKTAIDMADLWFHPTYIDLSSATNRALFLSAQAKPVNLGKTGQVPTGSTPIVFFSGPTSTWNTNLGSGGGFTLNGTLTDATPGPSG